MEIKGIYYCDVCSKPTTSDKPICSDECFNFAKADAEHNNVCNHGEEVLIERTSRHSSGWFIGIDCEYCGRICERRLTSLNEIKKYRNKFSRTISTLKKAQLNN